MAPIEPAKQGWAFSTIAIVASLVIAVASAAATYVQQSQQAEQNAAFQKRQVQAQNDAINQNSALANAAYINETTALQNRQAEQDAATAAREHGVQLDAAKVQSTAITAAGEAGVSGLSVNALLSDYAKQEVDYRFQSQTQLGNERMQTISELKGAQLQAEGRVDSVKPYQPQPISYPSLLGAALRVGADSYSAYNTYKAKTPQVPDTSRGAGPGYGWTGRENTP